MHDHVLLSLSFTDVKKSKNRDQTRPPASEPKKNSENITLSVHKAKDPSAAAKKEQIHRPAILTLLNY